MTHGAPFPSFCVLAFFSPGMGEVVMVLVVALLLFGTKRLPGIARNLGRALEEFRRAAREVTQEVMHATDDLKPAPPPKATTARGEPPAEAAHSEPPDLDDEPPASAEHPHD